MAVSNLSLWSSCDRIEGFLSFASVFSLYGLCLKMWQYSSLSPWNRHFWSPLQNTPQTLWNVSKSPVVWPYIFMKYRWQNTDTVKPVLNGPFIKWNFVLNGNIFRSHDSHSIPWLNGNLASAEKCSGPLRFRLRQVLLYLFNSASISMLVYY
jgi:hypothetical protein